MTAHEEAEVHALTGAYVLDAVSDEERAAFEAHLDECGLCSDEAATLRETAARLGGAEAMAPPPGMREAVLTAAARTRQVPPLLPTQQGPASATVTDLAARRARRARRTSVVLGLAAAVLAVVTVALGAQNAALRSDRAQLKAAGAPAGDLAAVSRVLMAPDARTIAGRTSGDGHGAVVYSTTMDSAVFVGEDLPMPPSGRTYQLWLLSPSGTATSAGVFRPDERGYVVTPVKGSLVGHALVGLTVEPAGGSPAPTTTPVLAVPLRA